MIGSGEQILGSLAPVLAEYRRVLLRDTLKGQSGLVGMQDMNCLYLISNHTELLYIGKTVRGVSKRVREHILSQSPIGIVIYNGLPDRWNWPLEVVSIRPGFVEGAYVGLAEAEQACIARYNPPLNQTYVDPALLKERYAQATASTPEETGEGRVFLIVGSRKYSNLDQVEHLVSLLPPLVTVMSGGPVGVDRTATHAARRIGLHTVEVLPDWAKYGASAGPRRNAEMVEQATDVYAFWDGVSRGTASTIEFARKAGKLRRVFSATDEVQL